MRSEMSKRTDVNTVASTKLRMNKMEVQRLLLSKGLMTLDDKKTRGYQRMVDGKLVALKLP